ncbi:MAG: 2-amino-4-hydroxy-6-hydroxymethyldihydropteridine diphosphokinase [Anaerovoracaceae bacterium]|jgi:2-amino-4-hydroxy-6-hydroxymethyldihydropteridine diphosphokinase
MAYTPYAAHRRIKEWIKKEGDSLKAVIALGSNMGDRRSYLEQAILKMEERCGKVLARSGVIETKAYGYTEQADFLNMAVLIDTDLPPSELLELLMAIEAELGRVRLIHWGPRTIDLDIIFLEDRIIDTPDLKVPHPDLRNREFVLRPVSEIAPDLLDPVSGKTVLQLLQDLKEKQKTFEA